MKIFCVEADVVISNAQATNWSTNKISRSLMMRSSPSSRSQRYGRRWELGRRLPSSNHAARRRVGTAVHVQTKRDGKLLFPILSLCYDKNGNSLLGLPPEAEDRVVVERAQELIPVASSESPPTGAGRSRGPRRILTSLEAGWWLELSVLGPNAPSTIHWDSCSAVPAADQTRVAHNSVAESEIVRIDLQTGGDGQLRP
jgi:hypothetical protein